MRSGFAPQTVEVPVGTVTVDGVSRDVTSVSTVREIGGGGVPGVRGIAAAEGQVAFAQIKSADSAPAASPWTRAGNFPPAPGSVVQVDAGDQVETFRALTGVVDDSAAGSDGIVSSSVIDRVDRLHRKVTVLPMLASMPPNEYGGPIRGVGMSSDWVVARILRLCGFHSTPPLPASSAGVDVPGQGSMWPERGTCLTASRFSGTGTADFLSTEWGWGMYDAIATYAPDGVVPMSGMEVSCTVSQYHASGASVRVSPVGSTATIDLAVNADLSVDARYTYDGTTQISCSLPAGDYRRVSMRVSAGSITLMRDDGQTVSGANPAPSSVMTANASEVIIRASVGARIGGVNVGTSPFRYYLDYALSSRLYAGTNINPKMVATPSIIRRDGLSVLQEIAEATCRAYWWDEDGMFHWMPGDALLIRSPSLTLTSKDNLIDLGWSEALADTFRDVQVDYESPVVSRSRYPDVLVWQGSGDSMGSSEEKEAIVTPSSGEEWIQTDSAPLLAGQGFWTDLNFGRRSWMGGVRTDGNTTSWAYRTGGTQYLTSSIEYISPLTWKFKHQTVGLPTGESVQLAMPNEGATSAVWQRWRGEKLPMIRAYGRVEWAGMSTGAGNGPASASTYQHAGGKWVQGYSGETAGRVATFLAQWLCVPRPKASGVRVVHDPRIQVGDVVTVRDEHAHGIELRVLVTRVAQDVAPGEASMDLDFFIISGEPAWDITLGTHDARQASTLATHDTLMSDSTLAEHDQNPAHPV